MQHSPPRDQHDRKRSFDSQDHAEASSSKRPHQSEDQNASLTPTADIPLLYYLARTAHNAAQRHLQQIFLPAGVQPDPSVPMRSYSDSRSKFCVDQHASAKVQDLLQLSRHLLQTGLHRSDLSDWDRIAFGLELAHVQVKIYKAPARDADPRNLSETLTLVEQNLALARKLLHRKSTQELELLQIRINLVLGKGNAAKVLLKQALSSAGNSPTHYYSLRLLIVEYESLFDSVEVLNSIDEVISESKRLNHESILPFLLLCRLRLLFHFRKWDLIRGGLDDLASYIGSSGKERPPEVPPSHLMILRIHLTLFELLWEGRKGNTKAIRALRKQSFALMDDAAENGLLDGLRSSGGLVELSLAGQSFMLQTTPPNILHLLTFYIAIICQRDYLGKAAKCKSLIYPRAMREYASYARHDDMWDVGFSALQGPSEARSLQANVVLIHAEVMLEEATALLYRSSWADLDQILDQTVALLRQHDMLLSLAPQLLLVHAMYAHMVGQDRAAARYYRAGLAHLTPGSELATILQIGLAGCSGRLATTQTRQDTSHDLRALAEKCLSTDSILASAGMFIMTLIEDGVAAKKRLAAVWDDSIKTNNMVLRPLLFAFAADMDVSGKRDRLIQQLKGGQEFAYQLGGGDKDEGLGQATLGCWYAVKLKETYRGIDQEAFQAASKMAVRYGIATAELSLKGLKRFKIG